VSTLDSTVLPVAKGRVEQAGSKDPNHADIPLGVVEKGAGIEISVPVSIGFKAIGLEKSQLLPTLKTNLLTDINTVSPTNAQTVAEEFLATFTETQAFFEQKIAFSNEGLNVDKKTVLIDGTSDNNETVINALVIDAGRDLLNTELHLKNIGFAMIKGNVSVFADDEKNTLIMGDNETQQQVFSKGGDDLITVGKGLHLVHGGQAMDTLQLEGTLNDYQIHQNFGEITITSSLDPKKVTQAVNIEQLKFSDQTITIEYEYKAEISAITGTYIQMFERQPELSGEKFWADALVNKGLTLGGMALEFMNSAEQQQKIGFDIQQADISTQVDQFYKSFLGRTPDEGGKSFWVNHLTEGNLVLDSLATEIITSDEMKSHYVAETGWDFFV
jgi:hypothetical protein